jgi:glycosyltransferase involved in cell wall biosynthesis
MSPEAEGVLPSAGVDKAIECISLSTRERRRSLRPTLKSDSIAQRLTCLRTAASPQEDRYYRLVGVEVAEGSGAPAPDSPLRVLIVIKCLGYGGAERLVVDMVATADRTQFDIEVAYVLREQDALVPTIRAGGTLVHPLDAFHNADLRWMAALRKLLVRGHYDVVHFHLPYAAAFGQLVVASLPRSSRPGLVYTEHSLWGHAKLVNRVLLRGSMGSRERLVAVSQASYDALPESLQQRATTVVHGVDLSMSDSLIARRAELRTLLRSELGVEDHEFLFLTVANLRPEKGYDVLLEAAKIVADSDIPIRIAAVGRGPLREALRARHAELGLGDRFQFLGQRDDVLQLLAGADAFVLASRHEGLPVALMEATSVGLPIVASRVGGIPQVLKEEVDALLVPPGESGLLAQAMERLFSDPELRDRLGQRAKLRSSMFDIAEANRAMGDIYLQVAGSR